MAKKANGVHKSDDVNDLHRFLATRSDVVSDIDVDDRIAVVLVDDQREPVAQNVFGIRDHEFTRAGVHLLDQLRLRAGTRLREQERRERYDYDGRNQRKGTSKGETTKTPNAMGRGNSGRRRNARRVHGAMGAEERRAGQRGISRVSASPRKR